MLGKRAPRTDVAIEHRLLYGYSSVSLPNVDGGLLASSSKRNVARLFKCLQSSISDIEKPPLYKLRHH
jgi:hypothetical protein